MNVDELTKLVLNALDDLKAVDVRVLDHFIVAGASSLSFMESGQL